MAEEAKKEEKEGAKAGGGKKKLLIMIVAAVVVLGGGGVGAMMMLGGGKKAKAEEKEKPKAEEAVESVCTFEPFIVNLADPKGNRFLKATLRLVVGEKPIAERMEKDELVRSRVRDRVISVLTSKTAEEVGTAQGKEALRAELLREINQALPNDAVKECLFADFIVQ